MSRVTMSNPERPRAVVRRRMGWLWVVLSSVGIAAYFVGQYMTDSLQSLATDHVGLANNFSSHGPFYLVVFYFHIIPSGVALLIGPFQFAAALRHRHPRVHRVIGRTYLISIALGAPAALIMTTINTDGLNGFFGFGTLAVLWAFVSWKGYRAIRTGDVNSHRAWMMRSFALTYAAVTLRLWTGVLIGVQIPFLPGPFNFTTVYNIAFAPVAWLCWIPNIVIVEFLIRARGLPSLRLVTKTPEPERRSR